MIIRRARIEDSKAIARVHVDSWRSTYAGMLPEQTLLNLSATKHEARWWQQVLGRVHRRHYVYVAEDEADGVVGFISGGTSRDRELDAQGEVYALYLLDSHHGRGVGKALFFKLAQKLGAECGKSLTVWVLANNPSRFFYEAIGGKRIALRTEVLGDADVQEIAYGWDDIDTLVASSRSSRS